MSRDAFLQRVRQAVAEGNRPGSGAAIPPRGRLGYQGGGADLAARFAEQLTAAGGFPYAVNDDDSARGRVVELIQSRGARKVLLSKGTCLDRLNLRERLTAVGLEVLSVDAFTVANCKEPFFAADVAVSGVDYLITETGSVAICAAPTAPRSGSLLAPVHIAVADRSQLLPDLFDLFAQLPPDKGLPSCVSLITGPSKTGDIELRLVTGVHGPGEIHVVLIV